MKLKQVREYGKCYECGISQQITKGIRFFEFEFGKRHISTLQLCEKCLKKLKELQQEE